MKRLIYVTPILLMLVITNVALGQYRCSSFVSVQQAQLVAINFFKLQPYTQNSRIAVSADLKYTKPITGGNIAFYVFDMQPTGFVIVAADNRISPILAYSTETNFNTDFSHRGVNSWMQNTSQNILAAMQAVGEADARITNLWVAYNQGQNPGSAKSSVVTPLVTTKWDQESLGNPPPYQYNLFCPYNSTDQQRCLTGCVATSMAQIMKFWNYPAIGTDSFSYMDNVNNGYSYNYGKQSTSFNTDTFDWVHMPTILNSASTGVEDTAVAVLMWKCAVSVGMDFGDDNQDGSGAEAVQADVGAGEACSQRAFAKYFSYNPTTLQGVYQTDYNAADWLTLLQGELTAGRPFIYEGNDATQGGHAWVCDGFDANNMFHINWGWSGQDNGYFAVTDFTTTGNFNPIQDEEALIGIQPLSQTTGLSVEEKTKAVMNVYPNPAKNNLIVEVDKIEGVSALNIKNILGQTLLLENISGLKTVLDISAIPSGLYLVQLKHDEESVTQKIIICK